MTDHWEFFPTTLDEHVAVVLFDQGIADELPLDGLPVAMRLRIELKHPREDGLHAPRETKALEVLEEAIRTHCEESDIAWVGRITSDGARVYFVYVDDADARAEAFDAIISDKHGYEWAYAATDDQAGQVYWDELFPSEVEWQVIKNRHVIEVLRDSGDALTAARRVDHWAWFGDDEARRRFIARLEADGYHIDSYIDPDADNDGFGVQFYHTMTPTEPDMYAVTLALAAAAAELTGEYDGWETAVITT